MGGMLNKIETKKINLISRIYVEARKWQGPDTYASMP